MRCFLLALITDQQRCGSTRHAARISPSQIQGRGTSRVFHTAKHKKAASSCTQNNNQCSSIDHEVKEPEKKKSAQQQIQNKILAMLMMPIDRLQVSGCIFLSTGSFLQPQNSTLHLSMTFETKNQPCFKISRKAVSIKHVTLTCRFVKRPETC